MIQLPERATLNPLADLRQELNLAANFEFKYHKTTNFQKDRFFLRGNKKSLFGQKSRS